jgi:hypothetical protein
VKFNRLENGADHELVSGQDPDIVGHEDVGGTGVVLLLHGKLDQSLITVHLTQGKASSQKRFKNFIFWKYGEIRIKMCINITTRVAGWFVFKPKIQIWVNFAGSCNGKRWYI